MFERLDHLGTPEEPMKVPQYQQRGRPFGGGQGGKRSDGSQWITGGHGCVSDLQAAINVPSGETPLLRVGLLCDLAQRFLWLQRANVKATEGRPHVLRQRGGQVHKRDSGREWENGASAGEPHAAAVYCDAASIRS